MAMLGVRFDLRVPDFAATTHARQYEAALDMAGWADRVGLDMVILSEHHGAPDGYLPAPLTLAAAVLGRTPRIPVSVAAILVPLHDPIRLAEQLAVLDLCAPGRLSVVAGVGYRSVEFAMAGVERADRGHLLEDGIEVLRQAWSGEPFTWRGRTVVVTPRPATPGGPVIMIGGSTEIAARRAARLHCGFFPALGDPRLAEIYQEECTAVGFDTGFCSLPSGPGFVCVAEDPEAMWARIGPHALFDAQTYAAWQEGPQRSAVDVKGAQTWQDVRDTGVYQVLTPDECVDLAHEQGDFGSVLLHPLMGGLPPELGWESLELFERQVLPRLRPSP
jgi:alkanesulfonate monooxygenase SsuD/methylene tetrahydromethanopterin reductase-like flavin-dependent oxidoreductase (luciferase family)